MSDVFEALADTTRRSILAILRDQDLPAGRIAEHFPQQRPAISKHLRILREAGLLHVTNDRQSRIYSLDTEALGGVTRLVRELTPSSKRFPSSSVLSTVAQKSAADRLCGKADEAGFNLDWD